MNASAGVNWPRWSGETAIVVGSGPSASFDSLEPLRDKVRVIAIKTSWLLVPWADVLYGSDRGWWIANRGAVEFSGFKASASPSACRAYKLRQTTPKLGAKILTGETGVVGSGLKNGDGHSGFQAINLAVQFGANRVVLFGFDMTLANGARWHSDTRGVGKLNSVRVEQWRECLDACASQFEQLGVEVLNASVHSALTAYRKVAFNELVDLVSLSATAYRNHPSGRVWDCMAG